MLRGARRKDDGGGKGEAQYLDCRSTNTRTAAKDEDGLGLWPAGCAVWEKWERNLEAVVDDGPSGAVTDA